MLRRIAGLDESVFPSTTSWTENPVGDHEVVAALRHLEVLEREFPEFQGFDQSEFCCAITGAVGVDGLKAGGQSSFHRRPGLRFHVRPHQSLELLALRRVGGRALSKQRSGHGDHDQNEGNTSTERSWVFIVRWIIAAGQVGITRPIG
jgi:hypothetical protein